eukprot:GILJ01005855.1.p1 GENE.GILJ01005855.1~~GILJ01005855.1.p1  ORF type:complete len:790 (-),score=131.91 GILJ01005855.1:155-2479(-)
MDATTTTLTKMYDELAHIPSPDGGWLLATNGDKMSAMINFSQRDMQAAEKRSFAVTHLTDFSTRSPQVLPASAFPLDTTEVALVVPSPSGKYVAQFRVPKATPDKPVLEIWKNNSIATRLPLGDIHGPLYTDTRFGGVSWSDNEEYVAYIAEKQPPKTASFFDMKKDTPACGVGHQFDYREDWGEKFDGRVCPRLFVAQWRERKVKEVQTGAHLSAAQPVFAKDSMSIYFIGVNEDTQRLGIIHCFQRPTQLYQTELPQFTDESASPSSQSQKASAVHIHLEDAVVHSTRLSPDGSCLIYLGSASVSTHGVCFKLRCLDLSSKTTRTIVDTVQLSKSFDDFPGIYTDVLPQRPWLDNGQTIVMQTGWRSSQALITVDIKTGTVTRFDPCGSVSPLTGQSVESEREEVAGWKILDVTSCNGGAVLSVRSAMGSLPQIYLITRNDPNSPLSKTNIVFTPIPLETESSDVIAALHRVTVKLIQLRAPVPNQDVPDQFEAYLMEPPELSSLPYPQLLKGRSQSCSAMPPTPTRTVAGKREPASDSSHLLPLLVFIHGGPHGAFTGEYQLSAALLCLQGYSILLVNYRGSTGFGQASLECLVGKCGTQDVADVDLAISAAVETGRIDKQSVSLIGGSHGGFLTAHLIGQQSGRFKAAIMRNPVINLPMMVGTTDIPDWCYVEGLGQELQSPPTAEQLNELFSASPMYYMAQVRTPVMLMLGGKDKRVPPSQGLQYYNCLRAQGVPNKLLWYPNDNHALDSVAAEIDQWMNASLWLKQFM